MFPLFNPDLPLEMFIDASHLGFGLVLVQPGEEGTKHYLLSASAGIKDVQMRYTSYELELTGMVWAIRKVAYYRMGNKHLLILTDHKALQSAMNRPLTPDLSQSVFHLSEEALSCNISVKWIPASDNILADALSRAPPGGG